MFYIFLLFCLSERDSLSHLHTHTQTNTLLCWFIQNIDLRESPRFCTFVLSRLLSPSLCSSLWFYTHTHIFIHSPATFSCLFTHTHIDTLTLTPLPSESRGHLAILPNLVPPNTTHIHTHEPTCSIYTLYIIIYLLSFLRLLTCDLYCMYLHTKKLLLYTFSSSSSSSPLLEMDLPASVCSPFTTTILVAFCVYYYIQTIYMNYVIYL